MIPNPSRSRLLHHLPVTRIPLRWKIVKTTKRNPLQQHWRRSSSFLKPLLPPLDAPKRPFRLRLHPRKMKQIETRRTLEKTKRSHHRHWKLKFSSRHLLLLFLKNLQQRITMVIFLRMTPFARLPSAVSWPSFRTITTKMLWTRSP